jgi:hypothetical protein
MKTMMVAATALAIGMGVAQAQGVGPSAPATPFTIWSMESAAGRPLTPLSELIRKAHNGEALNSAPTPQGLAQNPPAPGTVVHN